MNTSTQRVSRLGPRKGGWHCCCFGLLLQHQAASGLFDHSDASGPRLVPKAEGELRLEIRRRQLASTRANLETLSSLDRQARDPVRAEKGRKLYGLVFSLRPVRGPHGWASHVLQESFHQQSPCWLQEPLPASRTQGRTPHPHWAPDLIPASFTDCHNPLR